MSKAMARTSFKIFSLTPTDPNPKILTGVALWLASLHSPIGIAVIIFLEWRFHFHAEQQGRRVWPKSNRSQSACHVWPGLESGQWRSGHGQSVERWPKETVLHLQTSSGMRVAFRGHNWQWVSYAGLGVVLESLVTFPFHLTHPLQASTTHSRPQIRIKKLLLLSWKCPAATKNFAKCWGYATSKHQEQTRKM